MSSPGLGALRRLAGAAATSALVLLVAVLALLVVAQLVGYRSMVVRSGSMGDAVPVGSLVLTELVPRADIEVGDVAVVDPQGSAAPRLHRVIEVDRAGDQVSVITKGDANDAPDSDRADLPAHVPTSALVIPHVGRLLSAVGSRAGLLALATVGSFIVGWWALRALWSDRDAASTLREVRPMRAGPKGAP